MKSIFPIKLPFRFAVPVFVKTIFEVVFPETVLKLTVPAAIFVFVANTP